MKKSKLKAKLREAEDRIYNLNIEVMRLDQSAKARGAYIRLGSSRIRFLEGIIDEAEAMSTEPEVLEILAKETDLP